MQYRIPTIYSKNICLLSNTIYSIILYTIVLYIIIIIIIIYLLEESCIYIYIM